MATVVAIEASGGIVIAGDSRETQGSTVTSERADRVFDLDGAGVGAVGDAGDVDEFRRRLDSELRSRELETDRDPDLGWIARAAAEITSETGVEAVVGARDDEGVPGLRQIGPDGSVLENGTVALGSGAPVALGRLEGTDPDVDLAAAEERARAAVGAAAERDTGTGGDVDVWTLAGED